MKRLLVVLLVLVPLAAPAQQQTRRPRLGASVTQLTDQPQQLLAPLPTRRLLFCAIQGGAAAETVVFRGTGGSPTYATVNVGAGEVLGRSINAPIPAAGVEVVTSSPAGDVTVECTYHIGG